MGNINSSLKFIDYIVNKVEFYNNEDFEDQPVKIDFKIEKKITYIGDENNTFLVNLDTKIFDNPKANNYPFSMNIDMTGIFEIDECDIKNIKKFAETNAIAILFPYLRATVSTYSANANIQSLILPPINIVNLLKKNEEKK